MARQVLPWVGAAVGFWLGGPTGAQWGFAIGGMVGNAVDPQVINGPKLGEGQDTTASEGAYRPIVLGKGKVGTCIINQGPLIKRTIRHKQSKGGGPITTEERFYRTMAFAVGEPADVDTGVQLLRMWVDGKLVYDVTPTSQIVADSQEFAEKFTFYQGTMDQQPDPDLEAYMGAGNVSAYQGAPYIVFPHYDVTQAGGRAPMIHVELASAFNPSYPMIASRIRGGGASSILRIGPDWAGNWSAVDFTPVHVISANDGRVISYGGTLQNYRYSDNEGASWQEATGVNSGGSSGAMIGWAFNGTVLIPGGSNSIRRSSDNGSSYGVISGTSGFRCIIRNESSLPWIGINSSGVRRSYNNGDTWSSETAHGLVTGFGVCQGAGTGRVWFGGRQIPAPTPRLLWADDLSVVVESLPAIPDATSITCVHEHDGVVVAGTDNGRIVYKSGGSWMLSPYHESVEWQGISHNGHEFVIVGNTGGSDGVIASSADGESWIVRRRETTASPDRWRAIAPIRNTVVSNRITLSSVIEWLHQRVNIPSNSYDVSQLTDLVEGVVFGDGYTAADAIRAAGGWYFFDAGEFDGGAGYRIHYVKRGAGAVATLTDQDIVDGPEDWEREDSYERPRVLHVAYQNPVMDYGAPNIPIKRTSPDVLVVGERSLSVPFVHSDQDEVARRGDIAMTVAYTEIAGKYEVVLPVDWLSLAPTDTIGFSIRGRTRRLRMVSWRYSPDGTIKTEWMADRQSAYTSDLTALPPTPTTPPPPSIVGPTVSAVLDIPALTDSLDSLHLVLAASGQTPAWWGALHQRRLEAETDFSTAMVFNPPTTIMGVLSDDVSAASQHYTDTTNVVRVTLYSDDELDTHTQQQFLSENGAFALSWDDGGSRRWEILQYRDAVKVGDQEWELSTLARGRLDTTPAPHPAGSMFVLLDVGVRAAPAQVAWIGQDIEHRAVSNGQQPDQAVPYTEEYTGQSQREWPVAHLYGEIDGDDLLLTCVPRHRFGTEDNPVQSINHDGYRWTATDGSSSATADTAAPSHTFDVTGWGTPITVTVAQLNRITGAGPDVSETIDA